MQLRDYQVDCLQAIKARYLAGARRQLICLPTGTGKTVIFAQFPGFFRMKRRMLVLAHRPWVRTDEATSLEDLRYRCRRIDLLDLETSAAVRRHSPDAWAQTGPQMHKGHSLLRSC